MTVKAMPASARRMAASRPDMPAPMTTTWKPALALVGEADVAPVEVAGVDAVELELLEHQRHVLLGDVARRRGSSIISCDQCRRRAAAGARSRRRGRPMIASRARARTAAWSSGP